MINKGHEFGRDLLVVLVDVRKLYLRLWLILREEKNALKDIQHAQLSQVVAKKNRLLSALAAVEGRRSALLERWAESLQQPISLSLLINQSEEPLRTSLRRVQLSLQRVTDQVRRINTVNDMIVEHSLQNIKRMRSLLAGHSQVDVMTYNTRGKVTSK